MRKFVGKIYEMITLQLFKYQALIFVHHLSELKKKKFNCILCWMHKDR